MDITHPYHHPNLDHREEAVSILLVAVSPLKPDQEKVEGVAKLPTVPTPDLRGRSNLSAIFEREQLLLKEEEGNEDWIQYWWMSA